MVEEKVVLKAIPYHKLHHVAVQEDHIQHADHIQDHIQDEDHVQQEARHFSV